MANDRLRHLFIQFALVVITLMIYGQVHTFGFIHLDDELYMAENPVVQGGLTIDGLVWAFTTFETGNWHPLTWISLMIDAELFRQAGGPHMVNVLLHIMNTLLLFHLLRRSTQQVWASALAAAFFAVHPLHVESVAWVSERKDVLSAFFGLLCIMAYVNWTQKPDALKWRVMTCLFLGLGLLAKPMLVTVPVLLLLLDYWPLARWPDATSSSVWKARWLLVREKLPLFIMVLSSAVLAFISQSHAQAVASIEKLPVSFRLANATMSYVKYLGAMAWPQDLAVYYPLPQEMVPWWHWAPALLLMLVISVVVFRLRNSHRYLLVGWLWYVITLVPVIGFVQVGMQSMADRYTYIPSIGIFVALACGLTDLVRSGTWPRGLAIGGALLATGVLSLAAKHQVGFWKDSRTLFEHTLSVTSNNQLIEFNYGVALSGLGEHEKAIVHYARALELMPNHFLALVDMGISQDALGRFDRALEYYRRALRIRPSDVELRLKMSTVLGQQGNHDEAAAILSKAVEFDSTNAVIRSNLGLFLLRQGELASAMEHLERAVKLDPRNAQAQNNLGLVHATSARYAEAISCFKRALLINPSYANATQNLELAQLALRTDSAVQPPGSDEDPMRP